MGIATTRTEQAAAISAQRSKLSPNCSGI